MRNGNKSQRDNRVNSDVQRVIGHVIEFELKDPRISSLTSVVKTEVTRDLKICKCYISVLGSDEEGVATLDGLKKAAGFVRKRVAEVLNMRHTPEIHFVLDKSIEYGVEMSRKIDEVLAPLNEKYASSEDEPEETEE